MGHLPQPWVIYRLRWQVNAEVRRWVQSGQMWMFRYLDSNQDNSIQSAASCQLLNTGLKATDITRFCWRYCLYQDTGHADLALRTWAPITAVAQPSIFR